MSENDAENHPSRPLNAPDEGEHDAMAGDSAVSGVRTDLVALVAIVVMAGAGSSLYFQVPGYPALGLVAGLVAGIACTRWWRAALVGAAGVVAGFILVSRISDPVWHEGLFWVQDALKGGGVAALVGGSTCFATRRSTLLRPLLVVAAVVAIIGTMWLSGQMFANTRKSQGYVPIERLATKPPLSDKATDEDIFLNYLANLRAGQSFYPMSLAALTARNTGPSNVKVALSSPLSYRLPLLYLVLSRLPSPASLVWAMLLTCTFGVVAAFTLARQFVPPAFAIVAASLVASPFAAYTGVMLVSAEQWAGILGLCSVSLFVAARRGMRATFALNISAAAAALLAASIRELAVGFLLVGLVATLTERTGARRTAWIPWAAGLLAFIGIYAAHVMSIRAAVAGLSTPGLPGFPWFHPDGSGLVAAVNLVAAHAWVKSWLAWLLVAAGVAGSVLAPRDLPTRIMMGGAATAGLVVLLVVRPTGWSSYGGVPGYWGDLVIPTTLACAPLALAALSGFLRSDESAEEAASEVA